MRARHFTGLLLLLAGLGFAVLALAQRPRDVTFLMLGMVFLLLGAARLRRSG